MTPGGAGLRKLFATSSPDAVQTWFPFPIEMCLNGRAWLARQMDRVGLSYQRQDNRVRERIRHRCHVR
jgi:hypothetical protein